MEGYTYPEPAYPGPADRYPEPGGYEYYEMDPMSEAGHHGDGRRSSRSKRSPNRQKRNENRSQSRSPASRSGSRSTSGSRSKSHSIVTGSRKTLALREPSFMDAFRVAYLTPSKHKKNATKYLATQKREDHIHELLKADRLGSKRWLFYPRSQASTPADLTEGSRESCDQRIKVDGEFLRKYKRAKKIDVDAPIAKLKRWELILYKKLGFIQAV